MSPVPAALAQHRALIEHQMTVRNAASSRFFAAEAERLGALCRRLSDRFLAGGRLLAIGRGAAASDAQHVTVEFVHPVLVGKRALPALDLSQQYHESLRALLRPDDIVIGFGPPDGDPEIDAALHEAAARGALCIALPGAAGEGAFAAASPDPFVHQEIVEVLYHALWETVHVFFERTPLGGSAGAASFLYPFLGDGGGSAGLVPEVAASIRSKAACTERLREQVASEQGDAMAAAARAMRDRIAQGGTILCFGNGGSATDAADLAFDLVASPKGYPAVPAISLAAEPATLTAIANDVGADALFRRQIIAHARPQDVAIAISTSGGSANVFAGLDEARRRGLLTLALLGYDGGDVGRRGLADHVLVSASDQIPRIQEVHASMSHVLLDLLHAIRLDP